MAADAIDVGDLEFGALISSIQTDEARHAQQGEPTIKVLIENGEKEWGQFLIDHMFWRDRGESSRCSPDCRWTTPRSRAGE